MAAALDTIPEPFAHALDEVAIVIADEPTRRQLRESGLGPDDGLYGLYEGVPRTEYAADWAFMPNKITLFRAGARGGLPGSRGTRARGLDNGRPRAGPPSRDRRGQTPRAGGRLGPAGLARSAD